MSEYQAIYDAVRSRISQTNATDAIQSAIRDLNLSFYGEQIRQAAEEAEAERCRPSVLFRPTLSLDGDQYCALYGSDLMSGCAGFGATPNEAMRDFDNNWLTGKAPKPQERPNSRVK